MKKMLWLALLAGLIMGQTLAATAAELPAPGSAGTIRLAWYPAQIKASLTSVATGLGFFEEEGLTIEHITMQNTSDALTAVSLGKADIMPLGITQQLQFISRGSDLVIIGGSAMEGGAVITTKERADEFADFKNWRGVKMGTGRSFTGDFVIRNHLRKLGIIPDKDITILDLAANPAIIEAVRKGSVDVGYITSDGVAIAQNMGLSIGLKVAELDPYYPCCRQTANGESVRNNRDAYVAYQRALIRAYKVISGDHEAAIKVLMDLTRQDREYVETGLYGKYASRYNPSPAIKKVEQFNGYLLQEGVVEDSKIDVKSKIDASIFKEALAQILERYPNDPQYLELKAFSEENDNI